MAPLAPRSWPYARHSRGIYIQYIYGFNSLYLYYAVYLGTPLSSRDIIHVSSCSPWNCPSAWKWLLPSLWSWVRRRVRRCGSLDAAHQRVCLLWIYDPIKSERLFDWAGGQILAHFPIILDCFFVSVVVSFWSGLVVAGCGCCEYFGVNCQMAVTTSLVPRPRIVAVLPHPAAATDEMKSKHAKTKWRGGLVRGRGVAERGRRP